MVDWEIVVLSPARSGLLREADCLLGLQCLLPMRLVPGCLEQGCYLRSHLRGLASLEPCRVPAPVRRLDVVQLGRRVA